MVVAALLGEIMVRIVDPDLLLEDDRVILTSAGIEQDEAGAIHYLPHRSVRSVLLSVEGIEFDVRFPTNDLGLVDHRDYGTGRTDGRAWAFVGDSFAAGVEGGELWIPKLRDNSGLEIYNFGMGATGVKHFARILVSEARRLFFGDIVIIAISDDFYRPLWTPLVEGDEIRICPEGEETARCRERRPIAYLIDPDLADAALLARAEEVRRRASSARAISSRFRQTLKRSRLLLFSKRLAEATAERNAYRSAELLGNLAALDEIRDAFPEARIRFIQVPDKSEVLRERFDFDASAEVEQRGIDYFDALHGCQWNLELFGLRDRHPNAAGYEVLSHCVADFLEIDVSQRVASDPTTAEDGPKDNPPSSMQ